MNRAKNAVQELKRLRINEGPADKGVMRISEKVKKLEKERDQKRTEADFDATEALSKGELNDKIRKGIQEEEEIQKLQF